MRNMGMARQTIASGNGAGGDAVAMHLLKLSNSRVAYQRRRGVVAKNMTAHEGWFGMMAF